MADIEKKENPRLYTGCTLLDILLGGEKNVLGFEAGTTLGIQGASTAGKTFVLQEILMFNYYQQPRAGHKFKWIKDDVERGDKFNTKKMYGVDLSSKGHILKGELPKKDGKGTKSVEIEFDHSNTCEEMDAHLSLFLSSLDKDDVAIYSVDSLDALNSEKDTEVSTERFRKLNEGEEVVDAGSYNMDKQRFLANFFREKAGKLYDKKCAMILTMQEKDKMGVTGKATKGTSNGQSTKFYCSTMLDLKCVAKITAKNDDTGKQEPIGARIQATTRNKARCSRPGRVVNYVVYFTKGIDNVGSNIDYLFNTEYKFDMDAETLAEYPLCWGGDIPTLPKIKRWLEENQYTDEYKAWMRGKGERAVINCPMVYDWAHLEGNAAAEKYDAVFGRPMTRQQLRELCENDPEARKKLRELVIEKWEAKEDAMLSNIGFKKQIDLY